MSYSLHASAKEHSPFQSEEPQRIHILTGRNTHISQEVCVCVRV